MVPDSVKLAWAAGFYEGEGYIGFDAQRNADAVKNPARTYGHLRVMVSQCDPEPLQRFRAVVGVGAVKGPYARRAPRKSVWTFRTLTFEESQHVVCLVWSHLSPRRKAQARAAITQFVEHHHQQRGVVCAT